MADAFGIEKLIFCGNHIPMGRKMSKTSRATEKMVTFELSESALVVAKSFKEKGCHMVSLEITENSQPIHSYQFSTNKPIALIVGDENFGVSEAILNISDTIVHIEMFGQNSSMNVVQATNIALYEITKQLM